MLKLLLSKQQADTQGGNTMDIKEKIRNLPSVPGVYLMKDSFDSVIYVGKSKNLRSRVGSYFHSSKSHPPKVLKMVRNIKDFDYITTDTEFEAFMLECKLIKEIKPLYNKKMKSPESYCYIKIGISEEFPSIEISRDYSPEDGNLYFGPYTSINTVERGLMGIRECCRIMCNGRPQKPSPCVNHSLGLCIGVCLDSTSKEDYKAIIESIVRLLSGKDKTIIEEIKEKMDSSAEKLDFEKAAKYRDYLGAVKYLSSKSSVVEYTKKNKNIAVLEPFGGNCVKLFLIKGNKVLFSDKYTFMASEPEKLKQDLKDAIFSFFGNDTVSSSVAVGREEIDESQIIYSYLKNGANCTYAVIPQKWLNDSGKAKVDTAIEKLINRLSESMVQA